MGRRIYGQLKLAPDAAFLLAVLANFPFALAIDLESVLPSVKFERTPEETGSLDELKHLAACLGIQFLTNNRTPWIMTLPEYMPHHMGA